MLFLLHRKKRDSIDKCGFCLPKNAVGKTAHNDKHSLITPGRALQAVPFRSSSSSSVSKHSLVPCREMLLFMLSTWLCVKNNGIKSGQAVMKEHLIDLLQRKRKCLSRVIQRKYQDAEMQTKFETSE